MRTGEQGTSAELLNTEPHARIDASCTLERGIGNGSEPPFPVHQRETIAEQIRKRAFVLERRGTDRRSKTGSSPSGILFVLESRSLSKRAGTYDVRIPVSGFDAGETRLTALADTLVLAVKSNHKHDRRRESTPLRINVANLCCESMWIK
jgi:hypothetical protein